MKSDTKHQQSDMEYLLGGVLLFYPTVVGSDNQCSAFILMYLV